MSGEPENKRLVRFLPRGLRPSDGESHQEIRRKAAQEAAEAKKAAEQDGGQSEPEPPAGLD